MTQSPWTPQPPDRRIPDIERAHSAADQENAARNVQNEYNAAYERYQQNDNRLDTESLGLLYLRDLSGIYSHYDSRYGVSRDDSEPFSPEGHPDAWPVLREKMLEGRDEAADVIHLLSTAEQPIVTLNTMLDLPYGQGGAGIIRDELLNDSQDDYEGFKLVKALVADDKMFAESLVSHNETHLLLENIKDFEIEPAELAKIMESLLHDDDDGGELVGDNFNAFKDAVDNTKLFTFLVENGARTDALHDHFDEFLASVDHEVMVTLLLAGKGMTKMDGLGYIVENMKKFAPDAVDQKAIFNEIMGLDDALRMFDNYFVGELNDVLEQFSPEVIDAAAIVAIAERYIAEQGGEMVPVLFERFPNVAIPDGQKIDLLTRGFAALHSQKKAEPQE